MGGDDEWGDDVLSDDELDALEEAELPTLMRLAAAEADARIRTDRLTGGAAAPPVGPRSWPVPRRQLAQFPELPSSALPLDTIQSRVLTSWADCVQDVLAARLGAGLSFDAWARAAGVPKSSAVTAVSGTAWPSWRTLGLLCRPVGLRPVLVQDTTRQPLALRQVESRVKGPDRAAVEADAVATGVPVLLAAAWHNLALEQLRWYARATRTRSFEVADAVGVRRATWSEARPSAPVRWASLPLLLAVGDVFRQRLRLMPADRAWPLAPWDALRER